MASHRHTPVQRYDEPPAVGYHHTNATSLYLQLLVGTMVASILAGGLLDDAKTYAARGSDEEWDVRVHTPIVVVEGVVFLIALFTAARARCKLLKH